MNSSSHLIPEILKYVITGLLTGLLSFLASCWYTNRQLEPQRNITLVPISISSPSSKPACKVDQDKLKNELERIDKDKAGREEPIKVSPYESYLKALSSYKYTLEEYVPPEFLSVLKKDGILINCNVTAHGLTMEAGALLAEQFPYLMQRSCFISYKKAIIPIRVPSEEQTFFVGQSRNLVFHYDADEGNETAEGQFFELAKEAAEKEVKISVTCHVIGPDTVKPIGGQVYPIGGAKRR